LFATVIDLVQAQVVRCGGGKKWWPAL